MTERPRGRPKGEPSTVINVRLPYPLLERLDRYLDLAEVRIGLRSNRNDALRKALSDWLDQRESILTPSVLSALDVQPPSIAPPSATAVDHSALYTAYNALGKHRGFVRIHLLRKQLAWPTERFNAALRDLAAHYTIELHGGDPSSLTADELQDSYQDEHGHRYLALSWRA